MTPNMVYATILYDPIEHGSCQGVPFEAAQDFHGLELLRAFKAGDPAVNERHIWVLIVFSLWHQIYVERAYDPIALGWERAQGAAR